MIATLERLGRTRVAVGAWYLACILVAVAIVCRGFRRLAPGEPVPRWLRYSEPRREPRDQAIGTALMVYGGHGVIGLTALALWAEGVVLALLAAWGLTLVLLARHYMAWVIRTLRAEGRPVRD